jgi:hypothetical protein
VVEDVQEAKDWAKVLLLEDVLDQEGPMVVKVATLVLISVTILSIAKIFLQTLVTKTLRVYMKGLLEQVE